MALSIDERARRYVAKMSPSISGTGGHTDLFKAVLALVQGFDLDLATARSIIVDEFNPRCEPPWNDREIEHKLRQADQHAARSASGSSQARGYLLGDRRSRPTLPKVGSAPRPSLPDPPRPAEFQRPNLERAAGDLADEIGAAWFADRSPFETEPLDVSAEDFLAAVYEPGENICILAGDPRGWGSYLATKTDGNLELRRLRCWYEIEEGERRQKMQVDENLLPEIPERDIREGFLFLAQPVDGVPRPNGENLSWRSEPNVTDWRFFVLECDVRGVERAWAAVLAQLPIPIVAIYSSGNKSLHALVKWRTDSKEAWDATRSSMRDVLVRLGADGRALSAVRLTRLPNLRRGGRLQKLLYLAPAASGDPIVDQPGLRDVRAAWLAGDYGERSGEAANYYRLAGGKPKPSKETKENE